MVNRTTLSANCLTVLFILFFIFSKDCFCELNDIKWEEWKSFGLSEKHITSIAYLEKSVILVAGTQGALYAYQSDSSRWIEIPFQVEFSVFDFTIIDIYESKETGDIALALIKKGGGAVAVGRKIDTVPFFSITHVTPLQNVQSIAIDGKNADTLYYGYKDSIWQCVIEKNGSIITKNLLASPSGCFGSINPVCADLYISVAKKTLLAGGYDSISGIKPADGSLLERQDSVLSIMKSHSITDISEVNYFEQGYKRYALYTGTHDSSVIRYDYQDQNWLWLPQLLVNEPVKEMAAFVILIPTHGNPMQRYDLGSFCIIATKSGIYFSSAIHGEYTPWEKVKEIPAEPINICYHSQNPPLNLFVDYYVGTHDGVYHNFSNAQDAVGIMDEKAFNNKINTSAVYMYKMPVHKWNYTIVNNTSFTGNCTVKVLDCTGRIIVEQTFYCREGNNTIRFSDTVTTLPNGMYIIQFQNRDAAITVQQKLVISN